MRIKLKEVLNNMNLSGTEARLDGRVMGPDADIELGWLGKLLKVDGLLYTVWVDEGGLQTKQLSFREPYEIIETEEYNADICLDL
jgi:hypothetical protein